MRRLVEAEGGRVCFVRLHVSEGEQERRIGLASRSEFHKLTSLATLRRLRDDRQDVEQPPVDLEIDTESSDPAGSAAAIAAHFKLTPQHPPDRYPSR